MAKDFSISSKVLDTDKYVYREERDLAKTQVDWGTVSKELTTTINNVRDERETQKAEIEKANIEAMNRAGEFDQYNHKGLNETVLEGSEWAKNALSVQMDHMRRGLITPSENKRYQQRVKDGFASFKGNLDKFSKDFDISQQRLQPGNPDGEANIGEQYITGTLAGLGNLGNYELGGNAATGELHFIDIRSDVDPNDPASQLSLGVINPRVNQRINFIKTSDAALGEVEKLGEVVSASVLAQQGVLTMEDWRDMPNSKDMMAGMVNVIAGQDTQKLNILQDRMGYTKDNFTEDPNVIDPNHPDYDPTKVLATANPDRSGTMSFKFNPTQEEEIRKAAELALESQISIKAEFTKGFDADSPAKVAVRKEQQASFGYIDQTMGVITGNNTEFNSAASSLKTAWDKANPDNPMAEETPIDRSTDPNFILVNYANGEVEKIAKFKLDANGDQILGDDKKPVAVSDRLLVQGLLTKVAPVTGSTEALMDEYIKGNPKGLKDRGKRGEKTSYQGTGDKVIEDTQLGSKMILVEGSPMNVGDRFLAISKQEGSDEKQLAEYTTVINSILSSEFKDITADFEVSSEDITTWGGNTNSITVTIEGVPTQIEFDTVDDPAKLQSQVQKAINAAKKKIREKKTEKKNVG